MTAHSFAAPAVTDCAQPQFSKTLPKLSKGWTHEPTLLPTGQSLAARDAERTCSFERLPLLLAHSQGHDAGYR
jgi:hypothetical protein